MSSHLGLPALAGLLFLLISCQGGSRLGMRLEEAPQGWVSSGGDIFEDAGNPWFLDDGRPIPYCVEVDETSFTTPRQEAARLVTAALDYWKREFAAYAKAAGANLVVPLLERFREIPCDGTELLRFQLGWGTLRPEQVGYLARRPNPVSLAVRTHYDRRTMRGRGFVYVASDRGDHRHPKGPEFTETPWGHGGLLYRILVHELGHVLGLPHFGHGVMSAHYPERILKTDFYKAHLSLETMSSVLRFPDRYVTCFLPDDVRGWFSLPQGTDCLVVRPELEAEPDGLVRFDAIASGGGKSVPLGVAKAPEGSVNVHLGLDGFASLYLPPEQTVFSLQDPDEWHKVLFFLLTFDMGLTYRPVGGGEAREIYLKLQPDAYQVLVPDGGGIRTLLSFRENCIPIPFGHACAGL